MKKLGQLLMFVFICSTLISTAQDISVLEKIILDGDTILISRFPEITVEADRAPRVFKSENEKEKYDKLKKDVEIVYPYALLAGELLNGYNEELAQIRTKKQKRELTQKIEEELIAEFEDELVDLSMSQQILLIKLIDRQTGDTSYEILQEYRGYISAFLWQGVARVFGHNLKNDYDGKGDEELIEEIIAEIEREKVDVIYSELK